jgi:hypothetical protein
MKATEFPDLSRLLGAEHLDQLLRPYYIAWRHFNHTTEGVTLL